jgi:hypothetical protein
MEIVAKMQKSVIMLLTLSSFTKKDFYVEARICLVVPDPARSE